MKTASDNALVSIDNIIDGVLTTGQYIDGKIVDMRQFDRVCFFASVHKDTPAAPTARLDLIATEETETYKQLVKSSAGFPVTVDLVSDMKQLLAEVKAEDLPEGFTHWQLRLTHSGLSGGMKGAVGRLAFKPHYHFADLQGAGLILKSWE